MQTPVFFLYLFGRFVTEVRKISFPIQKFYRQCAFGFPQIMKKLRRWLIFIFSTLLLLAIVIFLSIDTVARIAAERRIGSETGLKATIEKLQIGFSKPTIHIENLILKNPAELRGNPIVEMPRLDFEYDRAALRMGKLHFKFLSIDLKSIHVVENALGHSNFDALQKKKVKKYPSLSTRTATKTNGFPFDGIDILEVTLGTVQFTSEKNPEKNFRQNFAVTNEVFKNLKTDLDFQTAGVVLILKAGLSGSLDFDTLLNAGSKAGKKSKTILQDVTEPLILETTNSLTK